MQYANAAVAKNGTFEAVVLGFDTFSVVIGVFINQAADNIGLPTLGELVINRLI